MANYLTFAEIRDKATECLLNKDLRPIVEIMINNVYLDEVLAADQAYPLHWLIGFDDTLKTVAPASISSIVAATGVFTTSAAHGFTADVTIVGIYNVGGMVEVNNRLYIVDTTPATTTFTLKSLDGTALSTTAYTAYTSGGKANHKGLVISTAMERFLNWKWYERRKPMVIASYRELEDRSLYMEDDTGTPDVALHKKTYSDAGVETHQLIWGPAADQAYDARYWYEKRPNRLEQSTDVPELPYRFHDLLVSGTIAKMREGGAEVQNPINWHAIYQGQLNAMIEYNRRWWRTQRPTIETEGPFMT